MNSFKQKNNFQTFEKVSFSFSKFFQNHSINSTQKKKKNLINCFFFHIHLNLFVFVSNSSLFGDTGPELTIRIKTRAVVGSNNRRRDVNKKSLSCACIVKWPLRTSNRRWDTSTKEIGKIASHLVHEIDFSSLENCITIEIRIINWVHK